MDDIYSFGDSFRDSYDGTGTVDTWAGRFNTNLYGHDLQKLCVRTQNNLDRIAENMSKMEPCFRYGMKHWHPDQRPKSAKLAHAAGPPDPNKVRWHDTNVMFTSSENIKNLGRTVSTDNITDDTSSVLSTTTGGQVSTYCYLCSTMEEHRRHMLRHRPKRPASAKPRIEYIAPKPHVKRKEEEEEKVIPERLYKVEVFTGDINGAGTAANVFITIKGSRDILNKTKLMKGRGSAQFAFLRNTKETFYLKAPKLGNLEIVTIEHDGLEKKHGWYLERIEITDMETSMVWIFWCKNWLSLHIKDYQISRDLYGKEKEMPQCAYEIEVITGKKKLAGTDAKVYLTMFGANGPTKKILLADRSKNKEAFERGRTDHFRLLMNDIGELKRIRIEHDGEGFASGWYLERITITKELERKEIYYFPYGGWIARDAGKGELFREIKARKTLPREMETGETTTYIVTVLTGDVRYAGTDANVFIKFCGVNEKSTKKLKLDDAKNNFERGMTDEFKLEAIDVGPISYIVIGHDNSGPGAGWFLDQVKVKRYLGKKEIKEYMKKAKKKYQAEDKVGDDRPVSGSRRPSSAKGRDRNQPTSAMSNRKDKRNKTYHDDDSDEDLSDPDSDLSDRVDNSSRPRSSLGRSLRRGLDLSDIEEDSEGEKKQKRGKRGKGDRKRDKDDVVATLQKPLYEEYLFPCNQWFASDEGDGLFVREIKYRNKEMFFRD
ncbi:hypothetical protein FSP39_022228 [Pinctada imbricata]|uniref:PLAT domain-containing protein n=1 Tax=Pinctada imbricata TaxID=66713 RepID=A0AA89BSH9_PINIB|nr:hypothetical protein FSP39_022228 [Pinctada imbricata]